uniref:SAP domain-containing protein n=1 Tax=Panagrolaimus sp. JU765 TaxID=591449 RepID=A0AC34Q518_9BILA
MSFGQKNTWPRAPASGQINSLFQGITAQQFTNIPGMIPNINNINALVNTAAFGNVLAQQQRPQIMRSASPPNKEKSFIGTITKFMESYGFIDDEVFFQTNVVTNGNPMLGARCMVKAVYNSSMPFHWNATSVQLIQDNQMSGNQPQRRATTNRWDPPNGNDSRNRIDERSVPYGSHVRDSRDSRDNYSSRRSPPRRDRVSRRSPPPVRRPSPGKSPVRRVEKRERSRERSRSPRRETTRDRTMSPPRRRARVIPRYVCRTIVRSLISKTLDCADLRVRYKNLYVPSDFITIKMDWLDSFNLEDQFKVGLNPITFHVAHKDVDIPADKFTAEQLEPASDEDHRFCVRTLLLSHNGITDFRKKVFGLLPDGSIDETAELLTFNKALHFLTGIRGRNEVMGLGGAWSPSKDGENPLDLSTQINTAVRSTREMIGVDLSACATWYKIAQLEYYRAERDRVDTVVLLMPDTSSISGLMPTPEEHAAIIEELKKQLADKIAAIDAEEFVSTIEKQKKEAKTVAETVLIPNNDQTSSVNETTVSETPTAPEAPAPTANETAENVETAENSDANTKIHWSTALAPLRVAELRDQLSIRGLDTKGVKNILIQRLQKALDEERAIEESGGQADEAKQEETNIEETVPENLQMDDTNAVVEEKMEEVPEDPQNDGGESEITLDQLVEKQDEDNFTPEELEEIRREREKFETLQNEKKQSLMRHYNFPEQPTVIVYPSKTAKGGRFDCKISSLQSLLEYRIEDNKEAFDCKISSLQSLLEYRIEDNKEASFEVFLFSECIREMFDRINSFNVYKTIQCANDYETEYQKRKDALTPPAPVPTDELMIVEDGTTAPTEATKSESNTTTNDKFERDILPQYKQLVGNFDLFSSFAYFDINLCGYLAERDCEDILLSIGVGLSRGDVTRLLKRVVNREKFTYRNYTDKWVDKDNEVKYASEFREDAPTIEQILNVHPKVILSEGSSEQPSGTTDVAENGVVVYKGAALNIKQTLEKHQEMKDEVSRLYTQVQEQEHVLKNYKEQVDGLEKKRKRLEADVIHYKKKAHDAERCLKNNEDDVVSFKSALQDCKRFGERLVSLVERVMPPKEKTKEPSTKPETPKKEPETAEVAKESTTSQEQTAEVKKEPEVSEQNGKVVEKKEEVESMEISQEV